MKRDDPRSVNTGPTTDADGDVRTIARLAKLGLFEYDRVREKEAAKLHVRPQTLDREVNIKRRAASIAKQGTSLTWRPPEPWPDPAPGAPLLTEVADFLKRYLFLPPGSVDAIALWTVMTWVHDELDVSPFLNITSATHRCGKTRVLEVIEPLVRRPQVSNSVTPAVLFRIIEKCAPTLLLDEVDRTFAKRDIPDLLATINGSQRRDSAFVLRCVGDDYEPRQFRTWCPKALAGIGDLPDTVLDRSIVVRIERRPAGSRIASWRDRDKAAVLTLQRQILRWVTDHRHDILNARREVVFPPVLHDRGRDAWEAPLAIGNVAGGDWGGPTGRAYRACVGLSADFEDVPGAGEQLLQDMWTVFRNAKDPEALPTAVLLGALHEMSDRPWPDFSRGKPLSSRQLSNLLRLFRVKPKTIRFKDSVAKGYARAEFASAWSAYPPQDGSGPVTPVTTLKTRDLPQSKPVTAEGDDAEEGEPKSPEINDVTAVTAASPPMDKTSDRRAVRGPEGGVLRAEAEWRALNDPFCKAVRDVFPDAEIEFLGPVDRSSRSVH